MKISTQITAALVAVGIVSQAMATDPVVYLTGSSAYRSTVFSALSDNSGTSNSVFQTGTITYGTWGNATAGSAGYMVFHGTLTNGQAVYINCAWSGSEAGIASACNTTLLNTRRDNTTTPLAGSPETWVDAATATLSGAGNVQSGNPGPNGSPANGAQLEASSRQADLAQADTSQAVSWTPATNNTPTALKDYGSEGVCTFTISRNVNPNPSQDWLDCTNVTMAQLNIILANGYAPAWFISGNPNDLMNCYIVGRNLGSGTRMNILSCSTYGGRSAVKQNSIGYGVDNRDPSQSVTTLLLQNEGNNGYESGGGVAKALANTGGSSSSGSCQQLDPVHNTGTNWFAIGYLSPSDALSTGNNGGQTPPLFANTNNWVTLDGVTQNNNNIENGSYWFWGHEHLYGKNQISGIQDTVGGVVFKAVQSKLLSLNLGVAAGGHDAAIPYDLMFVSKSSDVAFPSY